MLSVIKRQLYLLYFSVVFALLTIHNWILRSIGERDVIETLGGNTILVLKVVLEC